MSSDQLMRDVDEYRPADPSRLPKQSHMQKTVVPVLYLHNIPSTFLASGMVFSEKVQAVPRHVCHICSGSCAVIFDRRHFVEASGVNI